MSRLVAIIGPDAEALAPPFVKERALFANVLVGSSDRVARRGPLAVVAHSIDPEALLDMYEQHGEGLLDLLEGEFVFALWDEGRGRLLAARDRFGLRPLYEARRGETYILTNTLPSLLPLVPRALDMDRLGDLLVHGVNVAVDKTTYRAIGRIPPAHAVISARDGARTLQRYWQLPIASEPLRIGEREAQEELRRLLVEAARRRAGGEVVLAMSGGVDSTAVAAALVHAGVKPRALTSVWDPLIPDVERHFAEIAARSLGMEIDFQECRTYRPFDRWDDPAVRGYEPKDEPFSAAFLDYLALASGRGEVLLGGYGGDPLLRTSHDYFFDLLRRGRLVRFASEALRYALTRRKGPPLLLRSHLRSHLLRREPAPPPAWLRPHLQQRWREEAPVTDARVHPFRPDAFRLLAKTSWSAAFETWDPGVTGQPIALAAPWFDRHVVAFLLALPPMPHFADKDIVRQAMRGWLPEEIRLRPKTTLRGDPLQTATPEEREGWISVVQSVSLLDELLDRRRLCIEIRQKSVHDDIRQEAAAVALASWLARQ